MLIKKLQGPCLIGGFDGNYGASYILKTVDGNLALNTHYSNYLRIFRLQQRYLRPVNEKLLKVIHNFRFRKKKD